VATVCDSTCRRTTPRIIAQSFLLETEIDGRRSRDVPDFLLLTDSVSAVVDVKPASRASNPYVAFVLTWTRRAVEARGWRYEVRPEPPPVELANVRLLASHRRGGCSTLRCCRNCAGPV
jgi:hypothetical protein